jgi:hypothetical protein
MADVALTAAQIAPVNETQAEISTMIAAAAITKGQVVYQDTNGKANLARANATGTVQTVRGIALNDAAAGRPVNVLEHGSVYGFTVSGLNGGVQVFVSAATAGALADTAPVTSTQFVVPIGEVRGIFEGGVAVKVLHVDVQTTHTAYAAL